MTRRLNAFTLSLLLLGGAAVIAFLLIATRSSPTPRGNGEKSIVVELAPLETRSADIIIEAFGVARAANEANMQAQVAARIVGLHPQLRIGGVIPAGEPAIQLEKADFEAAVAAAEASVARAEANLALEEGRRKVAEREAELIGAAAPDLEIDRRLALREPQLADARASLRQAKSDLKTARLNLNRTDIAFPFDALVLNETADIGDFATVGASLGAVADVSAFWLEVEVPQSTLQRLRSLAQEQGENAVARTFPTTSPDANGGDRPFRDADVISLAASVSDQSRLGVALLAVDDPLARLHENAGAPSILLGSYVDVEINAGVVENVYTAPIAALRENDQVAVRAADGRLAIRDIDIVHRQTSSALIRGPFEPEDELVVSRLANAIPGMLLQTPEEADRAREQQEQEEDDEGQRVSDRRADLAPIFRVSLATSLNSTAKIFAVGDRTARAIGASAGEFRICADKTKIDERQNCDTLTGAAGAFVGRIAARIENTQQGQPPI